MKDKGLVAKVTDKKETFSCERIRLDEEGLEEKRKRCSAGIGCGATLVVME